MTGVRQPRDKHSKTPCPVRQPGDVHGKTTNPIPLWICPLGWFLGRGCCHSPAELWLVPAEGKALPAACPMLGAPRMVLVCVHKLPKSSCLRGSAKMHLPGLTEDGEGLQMVFLQDISSLCSVRCVSLYCLTLLQVRSDVISSECKTM